ncbi:hypothetical protein LUZ60_010962 [Juncus effusus]|nr:hypothetical protein LUZ60_010962 [Juncus effusus]
MENEDQTKVEKWEGKVSIDLPTINANQAWLLLPDFFSIHLWMPSVHTCEKLHVSDSQVGSIRYVTSPPDESGEVRWAKEELVAFNQVERSLSYTVIESNMGFGYYIAHFRVIEREDLGCRLEWSFECEPVKGWSEEGLVAYLDLGLKIMAERLEEKARVSKVHDDQLVNDDQA